MQVFDEGEVVVVHALLLNERVAKTIAMKVDDEFIILFILLETVNSLCTTFDVV